MAVEEEEFFVPQKCWDVEQRIHEKETGPDQRNDEDGPNGLNGSQTEPHMDLESDSIRETKDHEPDGPKKSQTEPQTALEPGATTEMEEAESPTDQGHTFSQNPTAQERSSNPEMDACPTIKNVLLLDSEGKCVAVKYYTDEWPTNSAKLAFEL
ncbi:hypothetical protein L1987_22735 [Smallanthus sonchifolius]|uniref:Uncharacterized protein n=1 Tax=Smallanthus sonchifolius TaxID=185202 RepID=A0ACB9IFN2_9ASTR|nr:hypothetical protein L1987_22735 [Smallanthus sonchifolius]